MGTAPNRRTAIVTTARQLFLEHGYEGTKIGDIAAALEISKAAISYYFPTKDAFLDELIEPLIARLETIIADHHDTTWPEGVHSLLASVLEALLDDIEIARWVDTDIAVRAEHHFGDRLGALNDHIIRTITQGSTDPVALIGAAATIGGIWRPVRELDLDHLRDHTTHVVEAAMMSYAPISSDPLHNT